jgi:hypothetical protein
MLINDDECDTEYPDLLEEERNLYDPSNAGTNPAPSTILLANIHVARLLAPLAKLFRSLCITNDTLSKFEGHLRECMQLFPEGLQLRTNGPLDPRSLSPLVSFQNTRLMLHRHNLSPSCSSEQRVQAIVQCIEVAQDTASLVARCLAGPTPPKEAEERLIYAATTLMCTHFWRCMLFLLFRPVNDAFFTLLRASTIIGSTKAISVCCGRHLSFCLRRLIEKFEAQGGVELDHDEELLVYLSGDLQASTNSWVWGTAETGTHLSRRQKHGRTKVPSQDSDHVSPVSAQSPSWDSMLSQEEQQDWGGWEQLEHVARYLQQQQQQRLHQQIHQHDKPVSILPRITGPSASNTGSPYGATPVPSQTPVSASNQTGDSGRSRMNIANII